MGFQYNGAEISSIFQAKNPAYSQTPEPTMLREGGVYLSSIYAKRTSLSGSNFAWVAPYSVSQYGNICYSESKTSIDSIFMPFNSVCFGSVGTWAEFSLYPLWASATVGTHTITATKGIYYALVMGGGGGGGGGYNNSGDPDINSGGGGGGGASGRLEYRMIYPKPNTTMTIYVGGGGGGGATNNDGGTGGNSAIYYTDYADVARSILAYGGQGGYAPNYRETFGAGNVNGFWDGANGGSGSTTRSSGGYTSRGSFLIASGTTFYNGIALRANGSYSSSGGSVGVDSYADAYGGGSVIDYYAGGGGGAGACSLYGAGGAGGRGGNGGHDHDWSPGFPGGNGSGWGSGGGGGGGAGGWNEYRAGGTGGSGTGGVVILW